MADPTKRTPADILRDLNTLRQGKIPTGDKAPVAPPQPKPMRDPRLDQGMIYTGGRGKDVNLPLERKATLEQMRD